MMSAEAAFQKCANTSAAFFASPPAYIPYHVSSHASARGIMKDRPDDRTVYLRTADDRAIIIDRTHPNRVVGHPFPVQPTFDPLSEFEASGAIDTDQGFTNFEVHNVRPYTYAAKPSTADVVVVRIADYTPRFEGTVDDETTPLHIHLTPLPALVARSRHWLSDLYIDRARWLPTRVVFNGTNNLQLTIDYAPIAQWWVATRLQVSVSGRIALVSATVSADATMDEFAFAETPPFDFDLATPTPVKTPR